jgi:cyclophilin family peptidyl-prolyl cis-trans isomerase
MSEKFFTGIIFVLLIVSFVGIFILFKNQNQNKNANSQEKSEVLSLASGNSQTDLKISPTMDMPNSKKQLSKPEIIIDKNKSYTAKLTTTLGDIKISLSAQDTPITVNNFVYLARNKFYDNTIFHRVIKGFMIQGGDPEGNGTGGPGYRFDDEPFDGDYSKGTIAMANAGPNTNGSQFFIMHADYALPQNYVIFGKVTEGLDVVDKIASSPVELSPMGEESKPIDPVIVQKIEIIEE